MSKMACKPQSRRDKKAFSPTGFKGLCGHLDFRPPAAEIVRQHISVVLSHSVCGALSYLSSETNTGSFIND